MRRRLPAARWWKLGGGENGGGAAGTGDVDGHEADRACAGDDDILRGNFAGEDGVHGVAERIENGGVMFWELSQDSPEMESLHILSGRE